MWRVQNGIKCNGMCTSLKRKFSVKLEIAPITVLGDFLIMVLTTSKLGATKRNFIMRLPTFNLLDIRVNLDLELPIRKI